MDFPGWRGGHNGSALDDCKSRWNIDPVNLLLVAPGPKPITSDEFFRIHDHLRDRKIEMIKEYRSTFGTGLKEAKDAVEAHLARSSYNPVEAFVKAARQTVSKHWFICVLDTKGQPLPASEPRLYSSAEQARRVAREMAEKNRAQKFVVYAATDVIVAPPVTLPETQAFTL